MSKKPKVKIEIIKVPSITVERHKKRYYVRGHYSYTKNGRRYYVRPHYAEIHKKRYKEKGKKFKRKEIVFDNSFDKLARKVAREYEKKGYSKKEAEEIGQKTAAKVYREKLAKYMGK